MSRGFIGEPGRNQRRFQKSSWPAASLMFLLELRRVKINLAHIIYRLSRELNSVDWAERSS